MSLCPIGCLQCAPFCQSCAWGARASSSTLCFSKLRNLHLSKLHPSQYRWSRCPWSPWSWERRKRGSSGSSCAHSLWSRSWACFRSSLAGNSFGHRKPNDLWTRKRFGPCYWLRYRPRKCWNLLTFSLGTRSRVLANLAWKGSQLFELPSLAVAQDRQI